MDAMFPLDAALREPMSATAWGSPSVTSTMLPPKRPIFKRPMYLHYFCIICSSLSQRNVIFIFESVAGDNKPRFADSLANPSYSGVASPCAVPLSLPAVSRCTKTCCYPTLVAPSLLCSGVPSSLITFRQCPRYPVN